MTTDAPEQTSTETEQPTVTEAAPETPEITTEVESAGTAPEAEAQGDAAEAKEPETDILDELIAPKLAAQREQAKAEVRAELEREEREKAKAETEQQAKQALNKRYQERIQMFDSPASVRELVQMGVSETDARQYLNALKGHFNGHHQDALTFTDESVRGTYATEYAGSIVSGASKALGKSAKFEEAAAEATSSEQMMALVVEKARVGWHSEAQLQDKVADALIAQAKDLALNPEKYDTLRSRFNAPRDRNGTAPSMRWTTKAEARAMHVQDKITSAEMRRINADPSIPEGY